MSIVPETAFDPFPELPRAISRQERAKRRKSRKLLRRRALRLLREARDTLDVLSRSEKASDFVEAMERAREEVRIRWERWEGLELDRMAELSGRVIYLSEAGIRLRREQDPASVIVPPGAAGSASGTGVPPGALAERSEP